MKYLLLFIATAWCYSGIGTESTKKSQYDNPAHLARVEARAVRHASYIRHIDSLVLSHDFTFKPSSFQREPAGFPQEIHNPLFGVGIFDGFIDVDIPFMKGIAPPYSLVHINYTLSQVLYNNYKAVQDNDGWVVSFATDFFGSDTYIFSMKIYSLSGAAELTVSNITYGTMTYSGSIVAHY